MKQLCDLNGKIVLIDWVGKESNMNDYPLKENYSFMYKCWFDKTQQALKSTIPTLEQDRSTWLELSERCGGKLEEGKDFKMCIDWDSLDAVKHIPVVLYATPTPQTEDLWEEAIKNANEYAADKCYREELCRKVDYDLEFINYLKKTYENPTRKS